MSCVISCFPPSQTKERYEKSLEELDKLNPQYMENMEQVFEQWQQFEDKRICFFKEVLLDVKQHLDLSTNHRLETPPHPGVSFQNERLMWEKFDFLIITPEMHFFLCVVPVDIRQFTKHWKTQSLVLMLKRT